MLQQPFPVEEAVYRASVFCVAILLARMKYNGLKFDEEHVTDVYAKSSVVHGGGDPRLLTFDVELPAKDFGPSEVLSRMCVTM